MRRSEAATPLDVHQSWQGQLPPADPAHFVTSVGPHYNPYGPPGWRQGERWRDLSWAQLRAQLLRRAPTA